MRQFSHKKMDWATFWATFSQAHLVALVGGRNDVRFCREILVSKFEFCSLVTMAARFFLTQYTKTGENVPNDHNNTQWT
jgi:hypothetical protein